MKFCGIAPAALGCQRTGMSTLPSASADNGGAGDRIVRGMRIRCMLGAVGLALLSGLILTGVGVGLRGTVDSEASSRSMLTAPMAPTSVAVMPAAPTDGVLTMVIPPGAAADQRAGGRGYHMPDVIQLTAGDTIVLRNDDSVPHMILYAFLMPS